MSELSPTTTNNRRAHRSRLDPTDTFPRRHLGPDEEERRHMLRHLGVDSLEELVRQSVPEAIRLESPLELDGLESRPLGESELLDRFRAMVSANQVRRSFLGMGYYGCLVPGVIQRNILENPGWYTQYTPYQAEISQGRLEALLNFQTLVSDLTALPVSNASLLDEGTAAAEAMGLAFSAGRQKKKVFFASERCHPQTLAVLATRAEGLGIELVVGDEFGPEALDDSFAAGTCGILLQYPATDGRIHDYEALIAQAKEAGAMVVMATDLLALTLLRPPGELGADIAVGSSQRFGVPMGYGGPHAAFMAVGEKHKRRLPGRIIGVSHDSQERPAYRMAMQTREQHIRREKATSNICTAQVLLAIMAGMYAVYHGPQGLRRIARRVHTMARTLEAGLDKLGFAAETSSYFDTLYLKLEATEREAVARAAEDHQINLRWLGDGVTISLDEATTREDLADLLSLFASAAASPADGGRLDLEALAEAAPETLDAPHARSSVYLDHPVFHAYHTEHEMLRYLHRLQGKDLSLTTSMIPLGSCTMKLNATTEMIPVTWPEIGGLHPFAPVEQAAGYTELFRTLESWLCSITGFDHVSLQPNAGSQGEYAGLMTIRAYHRSRGDEERDVCLIPSSAHGTNPASAVMAGMRVVVVATDDNGNVDLEDLRAKAVEHSERLGALMITYPSTHGVFEEDVKEICATVHQHGGQVYLDGANMNAQVGLCRPGDYGADVCHLNLHKTFCIPHGGGGPGMGPIGMKAHLTPFSPGHPVIPVGGDQTLGAIAAAPWGSASILPISWIYIALMGAEGLTLASQVAILNANYMAARLEEHYPVLYRGAKGRVAHELILDLRPFKQSAGIGDEDVAKRLMDYGFHAPTMSFPVPGTLMIEPTESESRAELDRFCDAMIAIRKEIQAIEEGRQDREDNPLRNAPHTAEDVLADDWSRAYTRAEAAFPLPWVKANKFWPSVSRIDNAYGDRNLVCTCPPMEAYED